MVVQHQEKTTCQHKFPPKSIETEKPGFSVKLYRLRWFGHVKESDLYTGQILDLDVEGNNSRGRLKKYWLDTIKDHLSQWNFQVENCQNRSECRKRLKAASHTHAERVT